MSIHSVTPRVLGAFVIKPLNTGSSIKTASKPPLLADSFQPASPQNRNGTMTIQTSFRGLSNTERAVLYGQCVKAIDRKWLNFQDLPHCIQVEEPLLTRLRAVNARQVDEGKDMKLLLQLGVIVKISHHLLPLLSQEAEKQNTKIVMHWSVPSGHHFDLACTISAMPVIMPHQNQFGWLTIPRLETKQLSLSTTDPIEVIFRQHCPPRSTLIETVKPSLSA
jgi:hypothetical protein